MTVLYEKRNCLSFWNGHVTENGINLWMIKSLKKIVLL